MRAGLGFKTQFFLCAPENKDEEEVWKGNEEEDDDDEDEEEEDGSLFFLLPEDSLPLRHKMSLTLEDLLVFVLDGL